MILELTVRSSSTESDSMPEGEKKAKPVAGGEKKPVAKAGGEKPVAKPAAKPAAKAPAAKADANPTASEKKPAAKKPAGDPAKAKSAAAPAKSAADVLSFNCARCKAKLKVPVANAGKYIDCPKCKQKTPVPESQEEADFEASDYGVKQTAVEVPTKCTGCGKKLPKGAVLCVNCGFDYREGRKLETQDSTLKEGEETRGGVALKYMIAEVVAIAIPIGLLIFRFADAEWWERGGYLGLVLFLVAFAVKHGIMWQVNSRIPRRDSPTVKEEDREERKEAGQPYGGLTAVVVLGCIGAGVGLGFLLWGSDDKKGSKPPAKKAAVTIASSTIA